MRSAVLIAIFSILIAGPVLAAEFKDVPKDHWASQYVQRVAADGVMKGYPDTTFKGDKPVTRYELAVALERMIAYVQQGLKPEVNKPESKVQSQKPGVPSPKLKVESQDPAQVLKQGGYIAADSPLLTNRDKTVTPTELAQALSSVAAKLIEKNVPPPKN